MQMNAILSCFLVAILGATSVQAATPEQFVVEYSAALQSEGLPAFVRFVHPDEAERFKAMLVPLVHSDKKLGPYVWREFLFGGGTTIEQAEAKTGTQYLGALLQRIGANIPSFRIGDVTVLGSVREGEIVHVVTRGSVEALGLKSTKVEVISVKPFEGGWKLMLSGEIEGLTNALIKSP